MQQCQVWLEIEESLLAESPVMLVDDRSMKNNASSLENLQKKSREKVERIDDFFDLDLFE